MWLNMKHDSSHQKDCHWQCWLLNNKDNAWLVLIRRPLVKELTYPCIHDSSFTRTVQEKPSLLTSRFWFAVEPSRTRLQNVLVQDASLRPLTWTSCMPGLVGLISCPKENKQKRRQTFVFSSSARTLLATKLRVFPELEIWWLLWSTFWETFIVVIGYRCSSKIWGCTTASQKQPFP